jgi:putative SOS response-associated peptidase YedK
MCSRYNLTSPPEAVRATFRLKDIDGFPPRYNIAPTQPVGIIRASPSGEPEFHLVRWGLIPSWVKAPDGRATLINARSETAAEKPSFRGAFRHRRCVIPANGFYEWTGKPGEKVPYLIRARGASAYATGGDAAAGAGGLLALAGLWEHWVGADGSELETMAILTVAANRTVARVHDRMPALLPLADAEAWLDCRSGSSVAAGPMLNPAPDDILETLEISRAVNNVRNEGPELHTPARTTLF